ncbi:MAG: hypothetical protein QF797_05540 [Alphaproteobacteria bacterium]|jgi:hypothetical protein|nr:hypothetical protein [Alphaproteobacteria bacterium]
MPRNPEARRYDGQIFRPISVREKPTPTGKAIRVICWETRCPDCRQWFNFENAIGFPKHPRRRCDSCRRPGKAAALPPRHKPLRYRNNGRKKRATT